MIIKGKSTTGRALATHLLKPENERVEVLEIRGAAINDLREAIDDWRDYAKGTSCDKPLYHVQLNPDRDLSREEWDKAISIFEKEMGLEGHPRAVVLHEKKGREHVHIVYSRFDHKLEQEHMRAWSDSWNYPKHERASRDIEKELGLEKTQGVFIDREGERPERTPSHAALQQAEQTKIDPRHVKADVSALYQGADTGRAFVAALESEGYTLAKGDSRAYVVLDEAGGIHSLARVAGVKVAEIKAFLTEYPLQNLPSVAEALGLAQTRAQRPEQEQGLSAAPSHNFAHALGDSAQVTKLDAQRKNLEIAEASRIAKAQKTERKQLKQDADKTAREARKANRAERNRDHVTRSTVNNPLAETVTQSLPSIEQMRENRAEIKDLERQAFAAQLAIGTLEPTKPIEREAAAPLIGADNDQSGKGMKLENGAVNAVTDGVVAVLGGVLDFLSGDSKPPPTPEQQKTINTAQDKREAERQAIKDIYQRYDIEHAKNKEQERDKDKSPSLDLFRK